MAFRFHFLTIPHSGTRFVNTLLYRIGFGNIQKSTPKIVRNPINVSDEHTRAVEYRMNHWDIGPTIDGSTFVIPDVLLEHVGYPILTTLRHPYEIALSWATRKAEKEYTGDGPGSHLDLNTLPTIYNNVIGVSAVRKIVYFDISCPEEKRMAHVVGTLKALGEDIYEQADKDELLKYVEEWRPVGETHSTIKEEYAERGAMPNTFGWTRLERAVNWYNSKLKECNYDYITS